MGDKKKNIVKTVFCIIGLIIYFLSFIPYLFLAMYAHSGVQEGLFGGRYLFGFDAVVDILTWFCIIPIIPICLILEVSFFIFHVIVRKRKVIGWITLVIVVIELVLVLIPCYVYIQKENDLIAGRSPEIREYLSEKYGSEMADGIRLEVYDYLDESFTAYSPVLPDGVSFEISVSHLVDGDEDFYDDFMSVFYRCNDGFEDTFADYLDDKYSLPDNMHISVRIDSVDVTGFSCGDDYSVLFDRTSYIVKGYLIDYEELNDDIAIGDGRMIWNEYIATLDAPITDYLILVMKLNGENAYMVQIDPPANYNNQHATMKFSIYNPAIVDSSLDGVVVYVEDIQ
ncbi:MAG: hypothetical protein K5871_10265 [Lachnospiraceae bacterium]|nr:hypothetical protein [Lachnospiraceae bacterium]